MYYAYKLYGENTSRTKKSYYQVGLQRLDRRSGSSYFFRGRQTQEHRNSNCWFFVFAYFILHCRLDLEYFHGFYLSKLRKIAGSESNLSSKQQQRRP
jgi:hypothetical protein